MCGWVRGVGVRSLVHLEVAAAEQGLDHGERVFGLVHRHHVARLVDLPEGGWWPWHRK